MFIIIYIDSKQTKTEKAHFVITQRAHERAKGDVCKVFPSFCFIFRVF